MLTVSMPPMWRTQEFGVAEVLRHRDAGRKRIGLTSPTGGGKSRMACELIAHDVEQGRRAVLYTNRKMLREQLCETLDAHGIDHGVRAAGAEADMGRRVQVSSIQTEYSRVFKRKQWCLHPADSVYIDEVHLQNAEMADRIVDAHVRQGATVVGITATWLDIKGYEVLVQAGTTSELRDLGALVRAVHYGPDEPDTALVTKKKTGEYEIEGKVRSIWTHAVFGRVLSSYFTLNPEQRPAILFGPGVPESLWFAEQFSNPGAREKSLQHLPAVPAAHIDGDDTWIDGRLYKSDKSARREVAKLSKSGDIKIVCNRFVMREGIDWPWLVHGILGTVFGSLKSYLQSGGRLLRASPKTSKTEAIIQDHGGNWWRHGSLNADRVWELDGSSRILGAMREDRLREKKEREPICCPKCHALRQSGPKCLTCGFEHTKKSRLVLQSDGTLKERTGDIYRPRKVEMKRDTIKKWAVMYRRSLKSKRTFKAAEALFYVENHYYPPRDLPFMPTNDADWYRPVSAVPKDRLTQ